MVVTLRGPVDPESGMVVNLTDLKMELKRIEALVDHKHLGKSFFFLFSFLACWNIHSPSGFAFV